jgi:uncharacterized protein YecE (DUF72 family)
MIHRAATFGSPNELEHTTRPMTVHIGTSGWVYNHWRGVFYPVDLPQRDWFSFYARSFETVEINNSFYRLPSAGTFQAWRQQAPVGFEYAIKASRYLTHLKKLKDPEAPLTRFFEHASCLGQTLGPVLYQLPPNWRVNLSRFEHFLSALPTDAIHVIEFRDQSWLIEEVFRSMERHGVAHCIHDMHPLQVPPRVTARTVYLRFHGDMEHYGDYPPEILATWAKRIEDWHHQHHDVFVYFNNDIFGYAIKNALALKKLVGRNEDG